MKKESDVLGYSMVGSIAQELTFNILTNWMIGLLMLLIVPLLIDHFIHLMNC